MRTDAKKNGRPSKYTEKIAEEICTRIASGETVIRMCRDEHLPSEKTVYSWLMMDDKKAFLQNYEKARAIAAERMAEELIDIADNGTNDWMQAEDPDNPGYKYNGEHVQRSRLRVDTRKWAAARLLPKKYGDKIQQEHSGKVDTTTQIIVNDPKTAESLQELTE